MSPRPAFSALAAEHEAKILNKGSTGMMVIAGMLPEGVTPLFGEIGG